MIVYVDGPEKAGKTTLVRELSSLFRPSGWHVVHAMCRRPFDFDPWYYIELVKLATRTDVVVILDRGWISESVYTNLLGRPPVLYENMFEWHVGRAMRTLGCAFVLTESAKMLYHRRDSTDLAVDIHNELAAFEGYARTFGYDIVKSGSVTHIEYEHMVQAVVSANGKMSRGFVPPYVTGPYHANVAVVGQNRSETNGWLPFTSMNTEWLVNVVPANQMNNMMWTNAYDVEENDTIVEALMKTPVVVALGRDAYRTMERLGHERVMELPHPAASVRWGRLKEQFPPEVYKQTFDLAHIAANEVVEGRRQETTITS